jgi:hypothetical protein
VWLSLPQLGVPQGRYLRSLLYILFINDVITSCFVDTNNILSEIQSGFRKAHSCETSLNLVILSWKEDIDKGTFVVAAFLDLKRAFETIDRGIFLIIKVERDGVRNNENSWIDSYMINKVQKATGETSD